MAKGRIGKSMLLCSIKGTVVSNLQNGLFFVQLPSSEAGTKLISKVKLFQIELHHGIFGPVY